MGWIADIVDFFLNIDAHLREIVSDYKTWTYLFLYMVIFCETGLVITPFLPGDSLIFAAGAIAAMDGTPLNVGFLWVIICTAAIVGDTVNYWIGNKVGPRAFSREDARILKKKYLDDTQDFFERHGRITIILARFVPIIRTFAPFVAGIGSMSYGVFISYNVIGGLLWVTIFLFAGYFFGSVSFIEQNFSLVIIAIIVISVLPMFYKAYTEKRKAAAAGRALSQSETDQAE